MSEFVDYLSFDHPSVNQLWLLLDCLIFDVNRGAVALHPLITFCLRLVPQRTTFGEFLVRMDNRAVVAAPLLLARQRRLLLHRHHVPG